MEDEYKILLLEDSNEDAELIKKMLQRAGIKFASKLAGDRKEFIDAIEHDTFHIILSDHQLPQFSSVEALKIVKQKGLDAIFILVTGAVSEEFAVSIIQQGADDYLLKNNLNRLPAAILQALEKRQIQNEKRVAEDELKSSQEQLRQLFFYSQNIREEERARIAREIHDELGQQLTGLKMDVFWLTRKIQSDDAAIQDKIKTMVDLIDTTVKSVRRISSELRPGILDDLGLVAALDWQSSEFQKRTEIECKFQSETTEQNFEKGIATGIFRIFQETLTNVARHAQATSIRSTLEKDNGTIILTINDNGKGFDVKQLKGKRTLGIVGMGERASMMGGELKINSMPGHGTTTILRVPVSMKNTN
jgi:signal transduction histidine kinase